MAEKIRLLISDGLHEPGIPILEQSGLFDLDVRQGVDRKTLQEILTQYDGIILHVQTKLDKELLQIQNRLKFIGCASVGFDHVDTLTAENQKIKVSTAIGANAYAVADLTFAFILGFSRRLFECQKNLSEGKWDRKTLTGFSLREKTLGILGTGNIGKEVALRAKGFGMKVIAYDPKFTKTSKLEGVTEFLNSKEDVLKQADIVTIHVPLEPSTRYIIQEHDLNLMKKGSYLINTARGGLVKESDVKLSLEKDHLAGYGVDVFETEPLPTDHWIRNDCKVIATHHLGGSTPLARRSVAEKIANEAIHFFKKS